MFKFQKEKWLYNSYKCWQVACFSKKKIYYQTTEWEEIWLNYSADDFNVDNFTYQFSNTITGLR